MARKSENFVEWTKEEKVEFAEKRMKEMRKKNEELQKRYAEVEGDRIAAENRNSAVTVALKSQRKEKRELLKDEGKTEYAREWDRGKPDKDYWQSHEDRSYKKYRTGRSTRLGYNPTYSDNYDKDTWGSFSKNENSDHRYDRALDHHQSRKPRVGYRYDNYRSSEVHKSPKQTRETATRSNELYKKPQHSSFGEKYKSNYYDAANSTKRNSYGAHSRSSSWSGSDYELRKRSVEASVISSANSASLWNNDSYKEQQNALNRVEKWVVNVNKCQQVTSKKANQQFSSEKQNKKRGRRYYKFDRSSNHSSDDDEGNCCLPSITTSGRFKSTESSSSCPQKTKNSGDISAKHDNDERKKGFKTKLSPESYDKSEQLHKQGRFDNQEYRNDNKNMFYKNKSYEKCMSKNDIRFKSGNINQNARHGKMLNKTFSLQKSESWNQGADFKIATPDNEGVWNNVEQSDGKWKRNEKSDSNNQNYMMSAKDVERDSWNDYGVHKQESKKEYVNQEDNKKSNPQDPEDLWGTVDQSDVKWNVSDDEKDSSSPLKNTISKDKTKSAGLCNKNLARDRWQDYQPNNDEGTWSNVDQGDVKWNLSDSEANELTRNESVLEDCENRNPKSELHDMNVNEIAGKMAEKCQIDDGRGYSTAKNPVGTDEVSSNVDENSKNRAVDDNVNAKDHNWS